MTLAERFGGRSFFERRRQDAKALPGDNLYSQERNHTSPASEGDSLTGMMDAASERAPLTVRIIGDRDPATGTIRSYHEDVHGTVRVLPVNQEVNLT